jgi:hypothetical protein
VSVSTKRLALFITARADPVRMLPWSTRIMIRRPLGAPLVLDDEKVSSGTATLAGAPITRSGSTDRTYSADVTWRRSPSISTSKSAAVRSMTCRPFESIAVTSTVTSSMPARKIGACGLGLGACGA